MLVVVWEVQDEVGSISKGGDQWDRHGGAACDNDLMAIKDKGGVAACVRTL